MTSFSSEIYTIKTEEECKINKYMWTKLIVCLIAALFLKGILGMGNGRQIVPECLD